MLSVVSSQEFAVQEGDCLARGRYSTVKSEDKSGIETGTGIKMRLVGQAIMMGSLEGYRVSDNKFMGCATQLCHAATLEDPR